MRTPQPKLPSSVWGQIKTLLFQPETFFKALVTGRSAWLLMAVVLMLLTGVSEVRRQERLATGDQSGMPSDVGMPPSMDGGMPMGDPSMGGGGVPLPPTDGGGGGSTGPSVPINEQLEQILGATGSIMAIWGLLIISLLVVALFNRQMPRWNRTVQVSVWALVPLGVLALLQLAYYGAGGKAGEPGLLGIVDELPFYATLTPFQQSLILSASSRLTLFHLWTVALITLGARHTLRGRKIAVALVIVTWVTLLIFVPVITGAYHIEPVLPPIETLPEDFSDEMPFDEGCDLTAMETPDSLMEDVQFDESANIQTDEAVPGAALPVTTEEAADNGCMPSDSEMMPDQMGTDGTEFSDTSSEESTQSETVPVGISPRPIGKPILR